MGQVTSFRQANPSVMKHCTVSHERVTINRVTFDWRDINDLISELRAARMQAYLNENMKPFWCENILRMKREGKSSIEIVKWVRQNTDLGLKDALAAVRWALGEDIGDSP